MNENHRVAYFSRIATPRLTEAVRGLLESEFANGGHGRRREVADRGRVAVAARRRCRGPVPGARQQLGWLHELRQRCPQIKVVVLSVHDEESVRLAVLAAGADVFVLKRAISTDLLAALEIVRGSPETAKGV